MKTLWDILVPQRKRSRPRSPVARAKLPKPAPPRKGSKAELYARLALDMTREHKIRVRKWRSSMSGVAWQVSYRDGTVSRLIEAPRPKGPMSAAIFLHEVGHHVIGLGRYRPRCLEEYHAWAWAIRAMETHGITVTDRVRSRMHESLHYAVQKAHRRGLKSVPEELLAYCDPPPRSH